MKNNVDFVSGNTKKSLLAMTLPLLFSMILMIAYNIVDSLWIGNLMGETGYAALTSSTAIAVILSAIALGTSNGISILVSQFIGSGNVKKTNKIISTWIVMSVIITIAISSILLFFLSDLLTLFHTPEETFADAYSYLFIYILGFISIFLYMQFSSIYRCFGDPVFQLKGMIVSILLNAVIDPIFIHLFGLQGAAFTTVLSEVLCLVYAFLYLLKKKPFHFSISQFDKSSIAPILKTTIPSALSQTMPAISTTALTALVSQFGISVIAGYGVSSKLETLLFYPAMACNMALTTIVGQCTGARRDDRSRDYLKCSILFGTIFTAFLSLLVIVFSNPLSHLFVNSSHVSSIVSCYFRIVSVGYIAYMITSCFLGALSGAGHPSVSMFLMFLYYIVIRIPAAYLLIHTGLKIKGIWAAILLSHIIALAAAFICYKHKQSSQKYEIQAA